MQAANARGILGWGIYSASSWTWCIGLFLPIIMLRLFGWPGFFLFAIPNIAGVVIFGYLFDEKSCLRMLREHRPAIRVFSIATSAYQLFFIAWLWSHLYPGGSPTTGAAIALGIWVLGLLLAAVPDRAWLWLGVLVWLISMVLFITLGIGGLGFSMVESELTTTDLLLIAPSIIFGFLFCPWLDASFHRARIRSRSPHAFAVFAVAFAPMILLSCAYSSQGMLVVGALALTQITMQAGFTNAVHARDAWLGGPGALEDDTSNWPWAALVPVLAILFGTLPMVAGESTYLRLLGLYGLVFPAYALFFMSPWARMTPNRLTLLLLMLLLLPCALALDLAFVAHRTTWVPVAVGGLLIIAAAILMATRPVVPPGTPERT